MGWQDIEFSEIAAEAAASTTTMNKIKGNLEYCRKQSKVGSLLLSTYDEKACASGTDWQNVYTDYMIRLPIDAKSISARIDCQITPENASDRQIRIGLYYSGGWNKNSSAYNLGGDGWRKVLIEDLDVSDIPAGNILMRIQMKASNGNLCFVRGVNVWISDAKESG